MHIQEDPRTIISWLQRHNSFQLFCLTKITDFLQNPVLQLLQKIHKTAIPTVHDITFDWCSILYFVWPFHPFSQVNLGGKKKGRGGAIGQSYQGTDQGHGEHWDSSQSLKFLYPVLIRILKRPDKGTTGIYSLDSNLITKENVLSHSHYCLETLILWT